MVLTDLKNRGVRTPTSLFATARRLPWYHRGFEQSCRPSSSTHPPRFGHSRIWDELKRYPSRSIPRSTPRRAPPSTSWPPGGARYPAVVVVGRLGRVIPFLDYDVEIRRVLCSTNAIESLNARYRRAIKARGHFPSEQAAMKCLYLVTRSLDPTGHGRARWAMRWKPALNAFSITFADRFPAAETY